MAKKKKDKPAPSKEKQNFLGAAGRNMKYKDLKRKAVILGMPFPDACAAGVFDLIKYISNSTNKTIFFKIRNIIFVGYRRFSVTCY